MNLDKLNATLKNEPAYRARQAYQAIFINLVENWDAASGLPLKLREELKAVCPFDTKAVALPSPDKRTVKAAVYFSEVPVETVLMRHSDGRNTVCVSSQIGCALGCAFCATGKIGFFRSLKYYEIVDQVRYFARFLKAKGEKVTNIVFMGMGEPLLNYREVMRAVKIFHDRELFNISARKISISTVGIADGINNLAREPLPINLAVSVHAVDDLLRGKLMPINSQEPLAKILAAVKRYIDETGRRVMIEYVMLGGVNDGEAQAEALARLLKHELGRLFYVNLISYNPTREFKTASPAAVKKFKEILAAHGLAVVERYRFGRDVKGACGQLAGNPRRAKGNT